MVNGTKLDDFTILGIITLIAIFITFLIIYFVFQNIWKKHLLEKELKVSDDEIIQEYHEFEKYIAAQERPNVVVNELSTNKLFRIRNRTSRQDMEKNIKRALRGKNKMTIIYTLFESLDAFE